MLDFQEVPIMEIFVRETGKFETSLILIIIIEKLARKYFFKHF